MHHHRTASVRLAPRAAALAVVLLLAACASAATRAAAPRSTAPRSTAVPAAAPAAPAGRRPAHAWTGTYDVVADGFPEGSRRAAFTVARHDTGYALVSLQGPPGRLTTAHFVGDSAHVVWNLGAAEGAMRVWLHAAGDSVAGAWAGGDQQGQLHGRRRP